MKKFILTFLVGWICSLNSLLAMEDKEHPLHPLLAKIERFSGTQTEVKFNGSHLRCFVMLQSLHGWDNLNELDKKNIQSQAISFLMEGSKAEKKNAPKSCLQNYLKAAYLCQEEAFVRIGALYERKNGHREALLWYLTAITATLIKDASYKAGHYNALKNVCQIIAKTDTPTFEFYLSFNKILPLFVKNILSPLKTAQERALQLYTLWESCGLGKYLFDDQVNTLLAVLLYISHDPEISKISPLKEETFESSFRNYLQAANRIEKLMALPTSVSIEKYYEDLVKQILESGWPTASYVIGRFIDQNLVHYDEKGQELTTREARHLATFKLFRQSQMPVPLHALGFYLQHSLINMDLRENVLGSDIERHEAAAAIYRKAGTYMAWVNLSELIYKELINTDDQGLPIHNEQERLQAMYNCFIRAGHWVDIYLDDVPEIQERDEANRLNNLAALMASGLPIKLEDSSLLSDLSEEEKKQIIVSYLLQSNCSASYYNLARSIECGEVDYDEHGRWKPLVTLQNKVNAAIHYYLKASQFKNPFPEAFYKIGYFIWFGYYHKDHKGRNLSNKPQKQREEEAAYYFRKAKTSLAFNELGYLISLGKIDTDDEGRKIISHEHRMEACLRCWQRSEEPQAFHNLAYYHLKKNITSLAQGDSRSINELLMPVKKYLKEAIARGYEESLEDYNKLELILQQKEATIIVQGLCEDFFPTFKAEAYSFPSFEKPDTSAIPASNFKTKKVKKSTKEKPDLKLNQPPQSLSKQDYKHPFRVVWSDVAKKQLETLSINKVRKVYKLIKYIQEEDNHRGRPETLPLYGNLISRRINQKDRLIYEVVPDGIVILSCKEHYKKIGTNPLSN